MERINDTHRAYPRTLEQAFGPHCNQHISEPREADWQDHLVVGASVVSLLALVLIAMGVFG